MTGNAGGDPASEAALTSSAIGQLNRKNRAGNFLRLVDFLRQRTNRFFFFFRVSMRTLRVEFQSNYLEFCQMYLQKIIIFSLGSISSVNSDSNDDR